MEWDKNGEAGFIYIREHPLRKTVLPLGKQEARAKIKPKFRR